MKRQKDRWAGVGSEGVATGDEKEERHISRWGSEGVATDVDTKERHMDRWGK